MGSKSSRGNWVWVCGWAWAGVFALACANQVAGTENALADSGATAPQDSGSDATLPETGPVLVDSAVGPTDSGKTADTQTADTSMAPDTTPDTGGPTDSGIVTDTGAPVQDSSAGPGDCGTTPTLHPGTGTNLYCPFGPGGTAIECASGSQLCCISGKIGGTYPASDCETLSDAGCTVGMQADAGSARVECEDPATDCPAGDVCCGAPDTIAPVAACSYERLYGLEYTRCEHAAACSAGEFQVCATATGECAAGKTCTPFKATLDLGFCK